MSFKENVNLHVDKSAKLLNFSNDLLEHLNTAPSVFYQTKIRNKA